MMKAKVLRRMTSDDSDTNETISGNKENIDTNKAAVVIQSRKYYNATEEERQCFLDNHLLFLIDRKKSLPLRNREMFVFLL